MGLACLHLHAENKSLYAVLSEQFEGGGGGKWVCRFICCLIIIIVEQLYYYIVMEFYLGCSMKKWESVIAYKWIFAYYAQGHLFCDPIDFS